MHVSTIIIYNIIEEKKISIVIILLSRNETIGRQVVISGNDEKYIVNTSS